ncbi:MAG TPA: hypothetical protein VIP77_05410 [Jiangellaceae bacterium]
MFPRRFALVRHVDYTGVSGIGVVAYGVVFFDGQVALRWCSTHPATSLWDSIEDMLAIHGHGEATSVQWIDQSSDTADEAALSGESPRGRRARRPDATAPSAPAVPDEPATPTTPASPAESTTTAESSAARPVPPPNGLPAHASQPTPAAATPTASTPVAGTPTAPIPTPASLAAPAGLGTPWTNGRLMTAPQAPPRPDTDPRHAVVPDLPPPPPPAAPEPPSTSPNAGVPVQRRAGRHRRPPPPEQTSPPHDPTSDGGHR